MKQIVLTVYVVELDRACEFVIPADMYVETAISLIQKILAEEYCEQYIKSSVKLSLINANSGRVLSGSYSFSQLNIDGSEKLILV